MTSLPCLRSLVLFFSLVSLAPLTAAQTITWVGNGNWSDPDNWSLPRIPQAGDDVLIDGGGPVAMDVGATIDSLELANNRLVIDGATLSLTDSFEVASTATLQVDDGIVNGGTVTIDGALEWNGGQFRNGNRLRIGETGSIAIDGDATKSLLARDLELAVDLTVQGTGQLSARDCTITVPAGVLVDLRSDANLHHQQTTGLELKPIVELAGTLRKSLGAGETLNDWQLTLADTGRLEILSGTMRQLGETECNGGTIQVAADSSQTFVEGTHVLNDGSTLEGDGDTIISGGFVRVFDTVTAERLEVTTGGDLHGSGTLSVTERLDWTGGFIRQSGTVRIETDATAVISGDVVRSQEGRRFENAGLFLYEGTGSYRGFDTTFVNEEGATFEIRNSNRLDYSPVSGLEPRQVFINRGTLVKSTDDGTTDFELELLNEPTGVVRVDTGRLDLEGGGSSFATGTGSYVIAADAVLQFSANTHDFGAGATFSGDGELEVTDTARFRPFADVSAPRLTLRDNAELGGSETFTIDETFTWLGGNVFHSGTVRLAEGGTGTLETNTFKRLRFGTFAVAGDVVMKDGGNLQGQGGTLLIEETGSFDVQTDADFGFDRTTGLEPQPILVNRGLLKKTAGAGDTLVSFAATNEGTLEVTSGRLDFRGGNYLQTAGSTVIRDAILRSPQVNLNGGTLGGTGTVEGTLNNFGRVEPGLSPGQLLVTSSYFQAADAVLAIELGGPTPGTDFDQLVVNGTATLAGELQVELIDGFEPEAGTLFTILDAVNRSTEFDRVVADLPGGASFVDRYDGADVQVELQTPFDLALRVSASPELAAIGRLLTYTLQVTNAGSGDASNVMVTAELPPEVVLVEPDGLAGMTDDCTVDERTITCSIATLPQGETGLLTIATRLLEEGNPLLMASVTADQLDEIVGNDEAETTTLGVAEEPVSLGPSEVHSETGDEEVVVSLDVDAGALDVTTGTLRFDYDPAALDFTGHELEEDCGDSAVNVDEVLGEVMLDLDCIASTGRFPAGRLRFALPPLIGFRARFDLGCQGATLGGLATPAACSDGRLSVGCTLGDLAPAGGDGVLDWRDVLAAHRKASGLEATTERDLACGDLHPGTVTCTPLEGARNWCAEGDGRLDAGDVAALRRQVLGLDRASCAGCPFQAAGFEEPPGLLPGDVVAPFGVVDITDVVALLRFSVGLVVPDDDDLAAGDISPTQREGELTVVVRNDRIDIGDVVQGLRLSVGLDALEWPAHEIIVVLDEAADVLGAAAVVSGWPAGVELLDLVSSACGDGDPLSDERHDARWAVSCVSDPVAVSVADELFRLRYRAPLAVAPGSLELELSAVDDGDALLTEGSLDTGS
ncbi:MAG: hypothetical protein AAF533_15685 [Acidobacteriota bacterium]